MKNRLSKVDSKILWAVIAAFVASLIFSWLVSDTLNESIQGELYPFSKYPVVVRSIGDIIQLPGLLLMWVATIGGINHILLTVFENRFFKVFKKKLALLVVIILIIMGGVFVLDLVIWPIAAKANGYSSCPYDTLLFGSKTSTAWSKKEAYCYDPGVQKRLPTGTYDQVVDVAKYLEDKNQ